VNTSSSPGGHRTIYFDCYSGASGDMILGALLDCGAPQQEVERLLKGLDLPGWRLEVRKVKRHALCGTDLVVLVEQSSEPHDLAEIARIINGSTMPREIKEKSLAVFYNLAEAEAAVHGTTLDQVHFHEVGAVDAIIDIVGSVAALHLLNISSIYCSPLPLGRGTVQTAHGLIPLPGPAVLKLLQKRRVPLYGVDASWEMVTPTGAAILATLADSFGPLPPLAVEAVGYGAGKHDPGYPNFLRVITGTLNYATPALNERVLEMEANIDDLNPEIYGYLMEKLLEAGALDVYFTPIQMKKNRPAVKVAVLAAPGNLDSLMQIMFAETSTLGVRIFEGSKWMRPRSVQTVETEWGPVRLKIVPGAEGSLPQHVAPEYDDCREIARHTGLPLKDIYRRVEYLFQQSKLKN